MAHQVKGGETELTGVFEDSSALFGVVAEIEALVSSCSSSARSRRDQNHRDAVMTSHPTLGECSSGDWTPTTRVRADSRAKLYPEAAYARVC
jgi:hypothetical protein